MHESPYEAQRRELARDGLFVVLGSHGKLTVDHKTGIVRQWDRMGYCEDADCEYGLILRFDVTPQIEAGEEYDIITLGHWFMNPDPTASVSDTGGWVSYEPSLCPHHHDGGPHGCAFDGPPHPQPDIPNLAQHIERELQGADWTAKDISWLVSRYENDDLSYRRGVDDALIALVGWSLPTLVDQHQAVGS